MSELQVVRAGLVDYQEAWDRQRAIHAAVVDGSGPDTMLLLEHPPVYTLGLGADPSHVLDAHGIPVVQTDRGGEVTYHGPGQAVVYLLMDLKRRRRDARLYAREFVHAIEQSVIETLAAYNLAGERRAGAPGIYIADGAQAGAKIAALGLKIRGNGRTYHGVSLNVSMDLTPFGWINPCGYAGLATVDMKTLGVDAPLAEVQQALARHLIDRLKG